MSATLSIFVLPLLFGLLRTITGQTLTTEYLNITLPRPNACPRPLYDGADSIYLFGGCTLPLNDILKFTISSETLERVGSLPGNALLGTIQSDNSGNIFYFGGGFSGGTDVYKYDLVSNTTTTVAALPYTVINSVSIKYNSTSDKIFILGGMREANQLLSFDMATLEASVVLTNLPFSVNGGTAVRVGNKAYVFGAKDTRTAVELDLDTYELRPVGPPTLPLFDRYPSSVWDGNYAYVIGGYFPNNSLTDGLIQFDPVTKENNFKPVRNFPVEGLDYFYYAPASVFVPSRNRIYFFGGQSVNTTADEYINHDEIFYVDLTPLVQPTSSSTYTIFTCKNLTNGLYPHPTDYSLYIGCENEEMTVFSCPPPLLFDAQELQCHLSDIST